MIASFIMDLVIEEAIENAVEIPLNTVLDIKQTKNRQLVAYRQVSEYKNAILFIHGFTGSPTETFSNIPELLMKEEKLNGFNILSLGYSSSLMPDLSSRFWSADPDIESLSIYFKTIVENQLSHYDTIAVIAHSMGGLVAQNGLLKLSEETFKKITNFIMFGTPSGGLEIANSKFLGAFKRQSLNMGSKSEFILNLRSNWSKKFNDQYPFEFKTVAGLSDQFVKINSSLLQFHERYRYQIEGDHSSMVKAENNLDIQNQCFAIIVNDLSPYNTESLKASSLALNNLIANYKKIVRELEIEVDNLDAKGLKKLGLALDGLGEEDRAIEIIKGHKLSNENTDVMGVLAGRYKRNYLYTGNKSSDAESAMKYYSDALKISIKKEDKHQIYYHSINLAFLSLLFKDNRLMMKEYAELALSHCDMDTLNIWELSTIAESNLYLNNFSEAEKYYKIVKEKTKNQIRIRSSIYI
ncbi:tetratricopeptide repeat-containing protein [Psychroserpens burtonensis]|uniref:tetratricopeptide repeat-containing protein n=1 Tax=Psychroserpens burtonensis TaxID=49278 RepID=UPI0004208382|nr:tetratricopeptide repeat-containing protein [Psychroserpens burtonensis]